jgi:type III pantothenate kinase
MKLIADIGNSQIKIAETYNQKLLKIKSFPLEDLEQLRKYISKNYINKKCTLFYSSVLSDQFNKKFKKTLKGILIKEIKFKSTKTLLSVKNCYLQPSKLGSDRWAQIVAAHRLFKTNTLIVSCGSAISIDFVTASGNHMGGLILAGAERYSNCFSSIYNLKNIKLKNNQSKNSNIFQSNTAKQITSGYRVMISSSVTAIYSGLCDKGKAKPKLVLTGSYSKNLSNDLEMECLVEPYFVLKSLALIQNATKLF